MNLMKLSAIIASTKVAVKALQKYGLIHREMKCSRFHRMEIYYRRKLAPIWRCNKKGCRNSISIYKTTWFQNSKVPIKTALLFYSWTMGCLAGLLQTGKI